LKSIFVTRPNSPLRHFFLIKTFSARVRRSLVAFVFDVRAENKTVLQRFTVAINERRPKIRFFKNVFLKFDIYDDAIFNVRSLIPGSFRSTVGVHQSFPYNEQRFVSSTIIVLEYVRRLRASARTRPCTIVYYVYTYGIKRTHTHTHTHAWVLSDNRRGI